MYFYKIEVYYPFGKTNYTIMSHDHYFDNHQLNTIVQQAFDECIEILLDFAQQINRSVMAENHILTEKSHEINNLLNDLYEAIDENYTERLENDDELAVVCARAQLDLITKIVDEVKKIWLEA